MSVSQTLSTILPRVPFRTAGLGPLLTAVLLAACGGDSGQDAEMPADHLDMGASGPAEVVEALDSANNLFRADDMEGALEQYRHVVEIAPDLPTGWFGIYMVETRRGNAEAADSAFQRAMERAPAMAPPEMPEGHPAPEMPQGHPGTEAPQSHPDTTMSPGHPETGNPEP